VVVTVGVGGGGVVRVVIVGVVFVAVVVVLVTVAGGVVTGVVLDVIVLGLMVVVVVARVEVVGHWRVRRVEIVLAPWLRFSTSVESTFSPATPFWKFARAAVAFWQLPLLSAEETCASWLFSAPP
jgi:hypothetical protein